MTRAARARGARPDDVAGPAGPRPGIGDALRTFRLPTLMFVLFAVLLSGIGLEIYLAERAAIRRSAEETLTIVARLKAKAVSHWIDERREDALAVAAELAADGDLDRWMRGGARARDGRAGELRRQLHALDAYDNYGAVVLADPAGHPLLSTGRPEPRIDAAAAALARAAVRSGQLEVSGIHPVSAGSEDQEIHICAPIAGNGRRDGRATAVLILTIDAKRVLIPLIDWWPGVSPTSETLLVARDGDWIEYLNRPRGLSAHQPRPRLRMSSPIPSAFAARGVAGVMSSVDYRGIPVIAATTPIAGTPWGLVAKIDAQEVYAPLGRLAGAVSLIIGLLLALTGLLLLMAWRRQQASLISGGLEAETERRRLAQRYEALHRQANDIILLVDPRGRIAEANDRALTAYGLAREDLIGSRLRRLGANGAAAEPDDANDPPDSETEGAVFESAQKRADGSEFPVEISARRILLEGEPWRQLIIRDITERKRIERRAASTAAILKAEFELSPDGIMVEDERGRWLSFNQRVIDMWRIPQEILDARDQDAAFAVLISRLVDPAAFQAQTDHLEAHPEESSFDVMALKDGRTFERHSIPLAVKPGVTSGRIWFFRDITDRLQAFEARTRLAALVDSARDAIISMDLDGNVLTWNAGAEDIYGYSAEEMIGRSLAITNPGGRLDQGGAALAELRAGRESVRYEAARVRKDGGRIVVAASLSPIRRPDGALTAVFAIGRDITEQKRTERALATLSETSMAALRATDEVNLCRRICEIVVAEGGYRSARIGLRRDDLGIAPVARAGPKGPHGVSLRLPLRGGSTELGEIIIGLDPEDSFGPDETALLEKMAQDVAFGVSALRDREARNRLSEALEAGRQELRRLNWALTAYARSSAALIRSGDARNVMNRVCQGVTEDGEYPLAIVGLCDAPEPLQLRIAATAGSAEGYAKALRIGWAEEGVYGSGPSGVAIRAGAPVIVGDMARDPIFAPWRERAASFGITSSVTVPFKAGDTVLGVLIVYARQAHAFGAKELDVFQRLADELAFALSLDDERRRLAVAEVAQRKSDLRYKRLFEHARDGILLASANDGILDANPSLCAMVGFERDALIGRRAREFFHPLDLRQYEEIMRVLGERGTYRGEIRFRKRDGSYFPAELVSTPGPEDTLLSIIRDISERKRAEDAERRAEDALRDTRAELARFARIASLGEMVTTISHEINQPLAAIHTSGDAALRWLAKAPARIDEAESALRRIVRDSERANAVIQRIRAFHARSEPAHTDFDLNRTVLEVASLTRAEQRAAEVEVETDLAPDLANARGDRVQILQVIVNLMINAIEAVRPIRDRPRWIVLRTRRGPSGRLLAQVEDNGIGLDSATADRLFDSYFTTRNGGTGLGLAISRSIVEAHGGRIWAEPATDHGTMFQFTVPETTDAA